MDQLNIIIGEVVIPRDHRNKPKGFAYVELNSLDDVKTATDKKEMKIKGRMVTI